MYKIDFTDKAKEDLAKLKRTSPAHSEKHQSYLQRLGNTPKQEQGNPNR